MTVTAHTSGVRIGVLIAGGSSRRAGLDKRFLVLEGRTLLVRNLAFLRDLFPEVAVAVGTDQDLDLGDAAGIPILRDHWPEGSPLAGLATSLRHFERPVFALAADIAYPRREAAESVLAAFPGHDVALPAIGSEYYQPLFAAYGPACLAPMSALLDAGRHRIVHIFPKVRVAEVRLADESAFHNINTVRDFEVARRQARRPAPHPAEGSPATGPALVAISGSGRASVTGYLGRLVSELERLGMAVACCETSDGIDDVGPDSIASGRFAGYDLVIVRGVLRAAACRIEVTGGGAGATDASGAYASPVALAVCTENAGERRRTLRDVAELARFLAVRLDSLRAY